MLRSTSRPAMPGAVNEAHAALHKRWDAAEKSGRSGGKVQLSMQKMCQSHGGVWSQAQETCNLSPTEARQAAKQATVDDVPNLAARVEDLACRVVAR